MLAFVKNKPLLISSVLAVSFFALSIGSCVNSCSQGSLYKKEMARRLDFEEKFMKLSQEKASLLDKVNALEKDMAEEKGSLEATQKTLLQEQMVCQTLKDELQKLTKAKEALEANLKKALAENKKAKR